MNKTGSMTYLLSLLLLAGSWAPAAVASDHFGRLFTTPAQRKQLDELRKVEPEKRIKVDEDILLVEEENDEPELATDVLTVRGLVHRGDGKNTAWVNNSNTFEGGLSSQYINIGNIETRRVEIKIPSADTSIKLNVGQSFDPISEQYRDVMKDPSSTVRKLNAAEK